MPSLASAQAALIRDIVLIVAAFLIWGIGILTGSNLAGTRGAVLAFLFGPLGVLIAAAMGKDDNTEAHATAANASSTPVSVLVPPSAGAGSLSQTPAEAIGAMVAEQPIVQVAPNTDVQIELLRRILIYEAAQSEYLKQINKVAQWFFWSSIIGAAMALAAYICARSY